MKRILSCVLWSCIFASLIISVKATEVVSPMFDSVLVHIELTEPPQGKEELVFTVSTSPDDAPIDMQCVTVYDNTTSFNLRFDVSPYEIGKSFYMSLVQGKASIGNTISPIDGQNNLWLQTYLTSQEDKPVYQTSFYLYMKPEWEKAIKVMINETEAKAPYFPIEKDVYVGENVLSLLHINMTKEENVMYLSSEDGAYSMQFYLDDIYALKGGVGYNLEAPVFQIDGCWFVPLKEIAEYFQCGYSLTETETDYVHTVRESLCSPKWLEAEKIVNEREYTSKTDYLIWVSKKDFSVNVFLIEEDNRRLIKSMPCALGAPGSPTIEGAFEYIEQISRWSYASYYCGPVMRFYRGYALHSTLIRYNGKPYDDRVGVRISHGCIRLHPEDINWLVSYIPLHTKIIITP